jgi:uncharacterized protein (UPF0332 family)
MATSAFDWSEYLNLATRLSANADEASQRSAMSRAYYCVYHKASERAVLNGYVHEQSHHKLWAVYDRNSSDKSCRKLYNIGSRMKKERVAADYEPTVARLTERMTVQLSRASNFMARLSVLTPGLPLP